MENQKNTSSPCSDKQGEDNPRNKKSYCSINGEDIVLIFVCDYKKNTECRKDKNVCQVHCFHTYNPEFSFPSTCIRKNFIQVSQLTMDYEKKELLKELYSRYFEKELEYSSGDKTTTA